MYFLDTKHDLDSSRDTWEKLFQIVYKKDFEQYLDLINIKDSETTKPKRWYAKIDRNKQPKLFNEYPKFKMAGDCDFNFNEKKVAHYKKILDEENNTLLNKCANKHHSFYNFSFMPITGSMQLVKGVGYDRFDQFIYLLKEYYELEAYEDKIQCNLVRRGRRNKNVLITYLDSFNGVNEYCKKVYFIDESFVQRLLESSKMEINNRDSAIEYMKLAIEYWKRREQFFEDAYNIKF